MSGEEPGPSQAPKCLGYSSVQLGAPHRRWRKGGGREACCYSSAITTSKIIVRINKASKKQTSEQTRTRLGGAGKGRSHREGEWEVGSCCWHCGSTHLTWLCCWTLSQQPHSWLNLPQCRLEGEDVEVKEQGYLGSSSAVLM